MSFEMVEELRALFALFDDHIQAVVLRGAEGHFCAGGDIKDMAGLLQGSARSKNASPSDSLEDSPIAQANRQFGILLSEIQNADPMVIVLLEGSVMGGGFGLACVSDLALATTSVRFALPEVTLGITPAQIAPFVVQRIGINHTRRLALTGHRFKGPEALRLNLIHELYDTTDEMTDALDRYLKALSRCNPRARRTTKHLLLNVGRVPLNDLLDQAALDFANHAQDPQAQAGMMAKITKKPTPWEAEWTLFPSSHSSIDPTSTGPTE
jgi:isohexenylglutaconyl-CoA hydratase